MIDALPANALEALPEHARWTLANALRTAAKVYQESAEATMHAGLARMFLDQAAIAEQYADELENC